MRMLRILTLIISCLCAGCSVSITKTRFYVESEALPTITNDSSYGQDKAINNRIMVRGNKIELQRSYKF